MRRVLAIGFATAVAIAIAAWSLWPNRIIARNTDVDEGVYLMVARLLHRGYDTSTFFFDQFWLFPRILAGGFGLFGDSLIVGRLIVFAFSLAGLIGVAILVYQLGGRWPAAIAAILVGAIAPLYVRGSRMTMADVPAMTCIVWSLASIVGFRNRRSRIWIALSGLLAGMSLVMKPFAIGFVVTTLAILIEQRIRGEHHQSNVVAKMIGDLVLFGLAAIAIAMPFVNVLHPLAEYQRVLGFHIAERNWMIQRVDDRWRGLFVFNRLTIPLVLFAISGIAALRPLTFPLIALLGGEILTTAILLDMPPWMHHYILILPPLIVFAVLGFNRGFAQFKQLVFDWRRKQSPALANRWVALTFGIAILGTLIDLPWLTKYYRHARFPESFQVDAVVNYTEQTFQPGQYLISDDALVPYLADRLIPPPAINFVYGDVMKFNPPSLSRFEQIVREDHIAGVITTVRYPKNRQLMAWLNQNFPGAVEIPAHNRDELSARIYTVK